MSDFEHPTRREIFPTWGWQGVDTERRAGRRFYEDKAPAARVFRFQGDIVYLETGEPMLNPKGSLVVDEELLVVSDRSGESDKRYALTRDEVEGSGRQCVARLIEETVNLTTSPL